ncbi:platelet endothelial aggregation receptor 1-like [Ruditapes philippinarum]|uniref:platelet endothelial aggregation receptor 1-like n=1 Tax=Ruditapes philippinarum TaxID=129788 RepID=UPI00295B8301|nr:platelet endothelial aggregation receptor 1-like [Ruditapes philippinarum]
MATIKVLLHVYLVLVLPTLCIDADKRLVADTNLCQPLQAPGHSTIVCGAGFPFYSCTASCDAGYQFPSGMTSDKRECDQIFGEWFDPPGKNISDCNPVCKPDCQNGGKCILPNTCNCPGGFMGKQCQHPVSNCAPPHEPSNGTLTCHHDTSGTRCTVACNKGFKPARTTSSSYNCSPDGTWSPPKSEIPRCVSDTNLCKPLPAPGHGTIACGPGFPFYSCTASCDAGYQFPSGMTSDKRECDQMFGEWFDPPGKNISDCIPRHCQPLPAPGHGTIVCGAGFPFYSCTASCDAGYQFPSGMTSEKRECDQMFGEWFDPPGKNISDCIPVCKPNCQNGGNCILPNTCTCPGGFMGKQCQDR